MKWFTDLLTGPNDRTFELVNIAAMLGFLTGTGLAIANYIQHGVFDFQGYMIGYSGGIVALGGAIRIRDGITSGSTVK